MKTEEPDELRNFKFLDLCFGCNHALVIAKKSDENRNRVFTFGEGTYGQLGHGGELGKNEPQDITNKFPEDVNIVKIAAGIFCSIFISETGEIFYSGKLKDLESKEKPSWYP